MSGGAVFSGSTTLGYFILGAFYILLPVTAWLVLKKAGTASVWPVAVGAVVYFLTTRLSDLSACVIGASGDLAYKAAVSAELVCVFEEVGRYLAMRYPVANIKTMNSAVCYGIGHAGLECWIRGFGSLKIMSYGSRSLDSFTAGKTPEKAAQITERLAELADHPLYMSLLDCICALSVFGVHIALSLLIFTKIKDTGLLRWLLAAIGLHYFVNCSGWLASFAEIPLVRDLVGIGSGMIVIAVVCRIIGIKDRIGQIRYPESRED